MGRLRNKTAVITAGDKGIGKAIAFAYAKEGADIVIAYHTDEKSASEVVAEIQKLNRRAKAIRLEITSSESRKQFVEEAEKYLGKLDILVNSAGVCPRGEFLKASEQSFDKAMDVNFKGPYFLTQEICQRMCLNKTGGSVINISSSRDEGGLANVSIYSSSKAALTIFSRNAALELAQYRIRVNTISPGLTKTDMHKETWEKNPEQWQKRIDEIPIGRSGVPEDIAALAIYLGGDESGYTTGGRFLVDGGRSLGSPPLRAKL